MFAKSIVDSDAFIDMPISARLLYYDLGMRADDDGFVNSPKKIMRMIGATNDDMNILLMRKFVIAFESGVVVIKHWRIHNYIQSDRYHPTKYVEEKAKLALKDNGAYTLDTKCIQPVSNMDTEVRLGKVSQDKVSLNSSADKPHKYPTLEEVKAYCSERGNKVDPERWFDYYTSNGWKVGKNPMKDWKAAVRTWERQDKPVDRSRKNNTLLNYNEKGSVKEIKLDLSELDPDPPKKRKKDYFSNYKETGVKPVNLDDIALTLEDEL